MDILSNKSSTKNENRSNFIFKAFKEIVENENVPSIFFLFSYIYEMITNIYFTSKMLKVNFAYESFISNVIILINTNNENNVIQIVILCITLLLLLSLPVIGLLNSDFSENISMKNSSYSYTYYFGINLIFLLFYIVSRTLIITIFYYVSEKVTIANNLDIKNGVLFIINGLILMIILIYLQILNLDNKKKV